jgi:hypothetical protein
MGPTRVRRGRRFPRALSWCRRKGITARHERGEMQATSRWQARLELLVGWLGAREAELVVEARPALSPKAVDRGGGPTQSSPTICLHTGLCPPHALPRCVNGTQAPPVQPCASCRSLKTPGMRRDAPRKELRRCRGGCLYVNKALRAPEATLNELNGSFGSIAPRVLAVSGWDGLVRLCKCVTADIQEAGRHWG